MSAAEKPAFLRENARLTACIALADGQVFWGRGFGAAGRTVGELCFNTAMTGYQEVMTDPSYADQIVAFTFPHIGNTGVNDEDVETRSPVALGMVTRMDPTAPSNWRSMGPLDEWMRGVGRIGIAGVDTRRLTRHIRTHGMPHAALCHDPDGNIDADALIEAARGWNGLEGADLAANVTTGEQYDWDAGRWEWPEGYNENPTTKHKVVAIDFGAKHNILRCLTDVGCDVTVVPANASAADILALQPQGIFLTNGPGDPAATGEYAVETIRTLIDADLPVFGVCLGHQLLAMALGGKTAKMKFGHHGANHPVKDMETGKVEITSMNHGFTVDESTLPDSVVQTHVSLFDGSNCGLRAADKPVFSVQYHPEASPGPKDSFYLFERFAKNIEKASSN